MKHYFNCHSFLQCLVILLLCSGCREMFVLVSLNLSHVLLGPHDHCPHIGEAMFNNKVIKVDI